MARGPVSTGAGVTSGVGGGGLVKPGAGNWSGGGCASLACMKSVISIQSKRLAEDVNQVYDRQILYTTKIQFQRSRIEDLTFRIAKAEKELVSRHPVQRDFFFVDVEIWSVELWPWRVS